MAYQSQISRTSPTAFIFIVDQSGSMSDQMQSGRSKAEFVADALNRTLMNLITRCTKAEGLRDYFEIGVIAYGADLSNGLSGELADKYMHPISALEKHPLRVEDRIKKSDDGAGGIIEETIKFPVWFEAKTNGGTPMCAALAQAAELIAEWCEHHPDSYPPTILHVTDGESTDGDPEEIAENLRRIQTDDGNVLLFNSHVSTVGSDPIRFPAHEDSLPDDYAALLYRMSSPLPDHVRTYAKALNVAVEESSRGFTFNAEAPEIVEFFDIGTRASQLR